MTQININYTGELQKLELKPGEILVLKVDAHLSDEIAKHIRKSIAEHFGIDRKVIVLSKGMTLEVLSEEIDNVNT